jgi:hypothetical protein
MGKKKKKEKKKKKKKVLEPNLAGPTRSDKTIFYLLPFYFMTTTAIAITKPRNFSFLSVPFLSC